MFSEVERARLKARQGVWTIGKSQVDVVEPNIGKLMKHDRVSLGEIALKGASIILGYLQDPETMLSYMREDNRFYKWDVAVVHLNGYMEIRDWSKDMIINDGENVCSMEVELVVYSNPTMKEVMVVAWKDEF